MPLPKHVRRKTAKGRAYFYFATGVKIDGKEVLKPLPHVRDPDSHDQGQHNAES